RDVHGALGPLQDPHGLLPHAQLGGHRLDVQLALDEAAYALLLEHLGHGVDVVGVVRVEDRVGLDVREQGDLLELLQRHLGLRAQDQGVGLYAHAPQRGHRVLRWLRLELLARAQERHQRDVEVERVLAPGVEAELPYGLQERQRLDVPHRAAHLDQHHLGVGGLAGGADALLDLVGDVRDDLDGVREVGAAALLLDDAQVDLTGGDVVAARQVDVQEALVGADVQVGLGAVVGDEHLAVLVGTHRPGVHVDVGVDLHGRDRVPPGPQEGPDARGGDALAQARDHPPGDEDVLPVHGQTTFPGLHASTRPPADRSGPAAGRVVGWSGLRARGGP